MHITPADVIAFWRDAGYDRWFVRDDAFDARCRADLLDAHFAAARGELETWADTPDGALALAIVLDQIPRNVFRDTAHAYATDPLARHYAARAIEGGDDRAVDPALRVFFYMPFEHSEDLADQERSVQLASALDGEAGGNYLEYARRHREVIVRFGRFPHRNRALGRTSTPDEQTWLAAGGGF
ncbi:DUF924 family protein [Lysobacter sp. LF1]|uniref:DUF924 family protein n=1 Tax=Lysobacter stagni TaxID=3045172 RepID=A0ABT6XCC6_9GAMM|nr:DUF924 family protein [Lysobacter sp. LF1]MDI9237795.1 DUF924 family protein [Lysobacter sp. LF1]